MCAGEKQKKLFEVSFKEGREKVGFKVVSPSSSVL